MALAKELVDVLSSEEQPLSKRLKLADYVFTSQNISLESKETHLLNWITNVTSNNIDALKLFKDWLTSEHFRNLNRIDLSQNCIRKIYEVVWAKLHQNDSDSVSFAIQSSLALLNNPIFHEYFKSNLRSYFQFVAKLVEKITNADTFLEVLKNEYVFNKVHYVNKKFYKYFFELLLPAFAEADLKFHDDNIFMEICSWIQKHTLRKNFTQCEDYLEQFYENKNDSSEDSVLKYFLRSFVNLCHTLTDISVNALRIYFNSLCNEYKNSPLFIYKFSVILFEIIGFNMTEKFSIQVSEKLKCNIDFEKSMTIALPIFDLLTCFKIELDLKIGEISFSQFIQTLILITINISGTPNKLSLKIIYFCIDIDPLVVDSVISKILQYLLLRKNNCKTEYIELLTVIFKVFVKLHRIQNLISKMLPVLKELSDEKADVTSDTLVCGDGSPIVFENCVENVFPHEVLQCFSDCVTHLASWQIMNLFKTFLYHLKLCVDDNQLCNIKDESKLMYIEAIGLFLCKFLCSVRVAEHTVPDLVVNKFAKSMDELKSILSKFGNNLVIMEHNHALMRTFLNISYTWGELYMILSYYSTNADIRLTEIQKQSELLPNLTYIHSYLTAAQWSLISERVNNFGKSTCKKLMQNLFIQHIKAVLLFENIIHEEMLITLINNFMLSLDDLWYCIVMDPFILNSIALKMHTSQILTLVNVIIDNLSDLGNIKKILPKAINSEIMLKYLQFNILERINKLIKPKKIVDSRSLSIKVFSRFNDIIYSKTDPCDLLDELVNLFNEEEIKSDSHTHVLKVNNEKLLNYLKMLSQLPVLYTPDDFRIGTSLYLLAVLHDLKNYNKHTDNMCIELLEFILIGILRATPKLFAKCVRPNMIKLYLINNMQMYKKAFAYFLEGLISHDSFMEQIQNISKCLMENIILNEKYANCLAILLSSMMRFKKGKLSSENKNNITEGVLQISVQLVEMLVSQKIQSLTLYALTLKIYLSTNQDITQHMNELERYLDMALYATTEDADHEGVILFLSTILHHKTKFKIVKDDFTLRIWNKYKDTQVASELLEKRGKLIVLVFEHISNESFANITTDLLKSTEVSRSDKNDNFANYIDIWDSILPCNFNQVKSSIWLQTLQNLQENLIQTLNKNDNILVQRKIMELEIHLVQTVHIQLNISLLDTVLLMSYQCMSLHFLDIGNLCIKLLDVLLRYRKPLITDVLPSFLQQYRILLRHLCEKSDSNSCDINVVALEKSAHNFEMLTKNLVSYGRHVARIVPYLIADILKQYETVSLIPESKIHIDNCIYSLLEICDQHAISYLMRVLSTASTEIFKFMYENYNKYYRYKGKV